MRATLTSVRASQHAVGVRLPLLFWYGTRVISWPVTVIFARLRCQPTTATLIRLFTTFLAFLAFAAGSTQWFWIGIIVYFFSLVLDHVDGNLARFFDRSSYYGKYIDGLVDSLQEIPLPSLIGYHIYVLSGDTYPLVAGCASSLLIALAQLTMVRYGLVTETLGLYRARAHNDTGAPFEHKRIAALLARFSFLVRIADSHYPNLVWDLRYGGLLVGLIFAELVNYLFFLCAVQALLLVGLVIVRFLRGAVELDVHRRSRTASNLNPER